MAGLVPAIYIFKTRGYPGARPGMTTERPKMPGLMRGKRGLVMGVANDHSIAWGIARTLASHGADIAFTYQGEAQAKRLKPLAASIGSKIVLPADVEKDDELDEVFATL